jgi:lactate dehydrogenase-like 2-hydroxyacid dehydrogenase
MTIRPKILSLGRMDPGVDAELGRRFEVFRDETPGLQNILAGRGPEIAAIVTRGRVPTTADLIEQLPRLEIIANFGVGYDSIDVQAAARRGIVVTNTPGVLNDEMGDFAVALLLATIRRLPQADRYVREGRWKAGAEFPLGPSLRSRRIGIAGMGRIGKVIAKRLEGFDLPISYCSRRPQPDLKYAYYPHPRALAEAVDVLIAVLPGGAGTQQIVNASVLAALGPNGVLINVARGSVVDEAALIEALQSGTILAAGLDVFAKEPHVPDALLAMDNVVVLPHIGTATHHTRGLMRQLVIDNINSWFDGKGAITPVPETPSPKLS